MALFCVSDDNMQMRLLASLKHKYSKVFKFKGFHIKRGPPKGGGWALGPMLGKQDWLCISFHHTQDKRPNIVSPLEGGKVGAFQAGVLKGDFAQFQTSHGTSPQK